MDSVSDIKIFLYLIMKSLWLIREPVGTEYFRATEF